jgi:hypothetical protein
VIGAGERESMQVLMIKVKRGYAVECNGGLADRV